MARPPGDPEGAVVNDDLGIAEGDTRQIPERTLAVRRGGHVAEQHRGPIAARRFIAREAETEGPVGSAHEVKLGVLEHDMRWREHAAEGGAEAEPQRHRRQGEPRLSIRTREMDALCQDIDRRGARAERQQRMLHLNRDAAFRSGERAGDIRRQCIQ